MGRPTEKWYISARWRHGLAVGVWLHVVGILVMFDAMFLSNSCDLFCIGDEFEQSTDRTLQYATVNRKSSSWLTGEG
jgi:hypothetical protein